jgi:hypothetical protein
MLFCSFDHDVLSHGAGMEMLSVLLLASPLVDLQVDMKSVAPNYSIATSKEQVFESIEETKNHSGQELVPLHYLGVARCHGFHLCRFVIRASSYEQAYDIMQIYVNRINTSPLMQQKLQQGSAYFMGGLVSDEEANESELHRFVESASDGLGPLFVLH